MHLQDKKVSVIGLARSGAAAARFLARRGARVTVCDRKPREQLAAALREFPPDIEVRCGTSRPDPDADWVVLSPGVDAASPDLSDARARGVEILGELELAARFCPAPMIAVTGTNGKTTTATLLGSLLQAAGMDVALAGNIGAPFIECVESPPGDYVVVEVSSFQLETVHLFHPHIALILNLTADHLDRHGTLANYAALKARITRRQEGGDFLILNQDDAEVGAMGTASRAQKSFFSMTGEVPLGAYIKNGILFLRREETATPVLPLDQLSGAAQESLDIIEAGLKC
ncbi:MAG: UDP-N-acetylmuramoyl-L-alanine--D-glutamate ligase, partial [Nitrospinaceae bacterium]